MNPRTLADEAPETRFLLHHLALHYVGVETGKEKWHRLSGAPVDLKGLDPTIHDLLLKILGEAWDKSDARSVQAARFDPDPGATERRELRDVLELFEKEEWKEPPTEARNGERFFESSKQIEKRLFDCTPLSASSGLLLVADFAQRTKGRRYLAILKLRHADDRLVTLEPASLTELQVQEIKLMLTREVLKGIIWPNPEHPSFDLKLFDDQAKAEAPPARYFTEEFLGCLRREADARRAATLGDLPAQIADDAGREPDEDETRRFQERLIEKTEPTPEKVAHLALDAGLITGISEGDLREKIADDMGTELPDLAYAAEVEERLEDLADDHDLEYHPERGPAFCEEMDLEMTADVEKTREALIESGAAFGLPEPRVKEIVAGIADVPRAPMIREGKKTKSHWVVFKVPRRPGDASLVEVRITGPRETLRQYLSKKDDRRTFHIEANETEFREAK